MQNVHNKRPLEPRKAQQYRGRFAPSPSGFLHFGSLIAALASFLDAKAFVNDYGEHGKWLIRIEDIDPPREKKGASAAILTTLEAYGLHWDEEVLYQSTQSQYYRDILSTLARQKLSYYCQCTRAQVKAIGGIYQGHCRTANCQSTDSATRLINQYGLHQFSDLFQGEVVCNKALANEDFIIHRKDGLFAYQLAVVADDIAQGITHVVRGCDLLEPTARQLTFFQTLHNTFLPCKTPQYGHIPLAITSEGYKLSKQNKAPAINNANPQPALIAALSFLGQAPMPELTSANVEEVIQWAINNWQRHRVPKTLEINID
ncbi:tRNA glutamyl-Q(34) synthetase GluQRS [Colwellia psychrerythraea]|uniref:Glutamyl-Q tRNA(Asp) synthetase n=1 Tax=Colwellia psychrerythraea TaxID=28229 RepID=A0A099KXH9_COLPS|nr:tRNA glutamyl-Q(34) synthetase GluQRS [Colwellia psychrerythraea]KGJ95424.1 Glutamyl-Q tRNA(Asp) synthetase [Colwellia psychrerythraea]